MSSFVVAKGHIDAIVQACIVNSLRTFEEADETGQMLWDENMASCEYLYQCECSRPEWNEDNDAFDLLMILRIFLQHKLGWTEADDAEYSTTPLALAWSKAPYAIEDISEAVAKVAA